MTEYTLTVRPHHPDFLDLRWDRSVVQWDTERLVDLPKGISRHEVRFVAYDEGLYVVKELPSAAARRDYGVLRALESRGPSSVTPVGLVEGRAGDPTAEESAALITRYADFSFSYRELLAGPGFGARRKQMLDAFAMLLVELHLAGCFWGDCSLNNVLYRFDAEAIETIMVDGETAEVHERLSDGQRNEDLDIMILNVAGGMADIAAEQGHPIDDADLDLGEDIAERYRALWDELTLEETIGEDERYRIRERVGRLNDLGFDVDEVDLVPGVDGNRLRLKVKVGGRRFHRSRLRELTGIEASEQQAAQILSDLYHHQDPDSISTVGKSIGAMRWRVQVFEPTIDRLRSLPGAKDPVQAFCDLLYHRYILSTRAGYDVGTETALEDWIAEGRPGYPLERP